MHDVHITVGKLHTPQTDPPTDHFCTHVHLNSWAASKKKEKVVLYKFHHDGELIQNWPSQESGWPYIPQSHGKPSTNVSDWISEKGDFERPPSAFRSWISTAKNSEFPPERGRYHLYVAYSCPWGTHPILTVVILRWSSSQHIGPWLWDNWRALRISSLLRPCTGTKMKKVPLPSSMGVLTLLSDVRLALRNTSWAESVNSYDARPLSCRVHASAGFVLSSGSKLPGQIHDTYSIWHLFRQDCE